ncbi:3'-5' exonuclease [Marinomonas sp.]
MQRPSKEEIRLLPPYQGLSLENISLVETEHDAQQALAILSAQVSVGFDTESKPMFRKGEVSPGPVLIQLATEHQGFLFSRRFPAAMAAVAQILANPDIQKIGFGLKDDKKELRNKLAIDIENTKDLSITLKHLVGEKNSIGARAGVAMVLKTRLSKGAQRSNWARYPLKKEQILYAANDAHCAICIELALQNS